MKTNTIRQQVGEWVESEKVQRFIIGLILINAVTIGIDTYPEHPLLPNTLIGILDEIILSVFVLEIIIKLYAHRGKFFKDGWNIFDLSIVILSLLPATGIFSVVRTLRILRTLRLLKKLPKLRLIIDSLFQAIPSISWIAALLVLVFYVFAIIGTNLFGEAFPEWFGTLDKTMYTLFQIMTLESWSMGIARPVMEKFSFAPLFFIPFILVATYTALNIFIAVVVNAMNEIHKEVNKDKNISNEHEKEFIFRDNAILKEDIDQLKDQLRRIERLLEQQKDRMNTF